MNRFLRGLAAVCFAVLAAPVYSQSNPAVLGLVSGGGNSQNGTATQTGASGSSLYSTVTFTCNSNAASAPMAITVYDGVPPPGGSQYAIASNYTPNGTSVSVTTSALGPGANLVNCSVNGGLISLFDTVSGDPVRSYIRSRQVVDAAGALLANGSICFTPVDAFGHTVAFSVGLQASARAVPVCRTISGGAMQGFTMLGRSDQSHPLGVNYRVDITDASTGQKTNYGTFAITGVTWDMAQAVPNFQTAPPAAWAPTVTLGTVTTGAPGSAAAVTNSGSSAGAIFNFSLPQGLQGPMGAQGPQGIPGPPGAPGAGTSGGAAGLAATIAIGNVTAGLMPAVTNSGNASSAVLNFTIPQGTQGPAGTVSVGSVTSGATAAVTNSGTGSAATLNFVLPQGPQGPTGPQGPQGAAGTDGTAALNAAQAAQSTANAALPMAGGAMAGPLTLASDSPTGSQAASANYVAAQIGPVATTANSAVQPNTTPSLQNVTLPAFAGKTGCFVPAADGKFALGACGGSSAGAGPAIPASPAGATTFSNLHLQGGGNPGTWTVCSSATDPSGVCGGGTTPNGQLASGSGSQTFNVASPSLSGSAMKFTSNGAYYNALAFDKFVCSIPARGATATNGTLTITVPTPTMTANSITFNVSAADTQYTVQAIQIYDNSNLVFNSANSSPTTPITYTANNETGQHSFVIKAFNSNNGQIASVTIGATFGVNCGGGQVMNLSDDRSLYVPSASASGLLNLEFDPDYYDGAYQYFPSLQCRGSNSQWYLWSMSTNSWVQPATGGPFLCNLVSQPDKWHRVQWYSTIDPSTHSYTYRSLVVDGVTVFQGLNQTYSASPYSTSSPTLVVQQQIDNNSAATATTVYYDNYNYGLWFGPPAAATGGSSGTSGSYPSLLSYGADPTGANDSTQALKAALAATPAGTVFLPTQPNGAAAVYKISAPVTLNTNQQLHGPGPGAVQLQCTMSGPCLVVANALVSTSADQLEGFTLAGSGGANTIGLYLGGDPAGNWSPSGSFGDFVNASNLVIRNFGAGVQWGNNAWANNFIGVVFQSNATGLNAPSGVSNSGENIYLSGVTIANGGVPINNSGQFEFAVEGLRDDFNSGPITFTGGQLHVAGSHFEGTGGAFFQVPYGSPTLTIRDSNLLFDGTSGTDTDMLDLYPQTMTLVMDGVNVFSNHPVTQLVHLAGTIQGRIANLSNGGGVQTVVTPGVAEPNLTYEGFNSAPPPRIAAGSLALSGGPAWTSGAGAPSGSCSNGALYSSTAGSAGSTLYACIAGAWVNLK